MNGRLERTARPRLHRRFTHLGESDGRLALIGAEDWVVLEGELREIVRRVDGETSMERLTADLEGIVHPARVHYLLWRLQDRGVIEETPDSSRGRAPSAHPGSRIRGVARRVANAWAAQATWGAPVSLRATELGLADSPLQLVLVSSYLHPELRELGSGAAPLLPVKLAPRESWIGPRPDRPAACWSCLRERLIGNFPAEAAIHSDSVEVRDTDEDPTRTWIAPAIERVIRALESEEGDELLRMAADHVVVIHEDGEHTTHPLPDRSECPDRHPRRRRAWPGPVRIASRPRRSDASTGFRTADLARTYRRYRHLIDPVTGLVRRLERVPVEGTDLVHNYTASHPTGRRASALAGLRHHVRDQSGGKGTTDLEARVSALGEALERTSAIHRGTEPERRASLEELGDRAIHPNECMRFSPDQYAGRHAWNVEHPSPFQRVPEPFDPGRRVSWTPLWSLTGSRERFLPTAYVYFGFEGPGTAFCHANSNGLAAGNTLEEAILQGFLELVERDAVALWWYNRTSAPGVDLRSVVDPYAGRLARFYEGIGRDMWVLDVTADLGIPTFAALSRRRGGTTEDIIMGFGAHLDAEVAVRRALTELNQALPHVLQPPEERRHRLLPDFADAVRWWEDATLAAHPYLNAGEPAADLGRYARWTSENLRDAIDDCLTLASRRGLEVLVADLTREDIGLSVARVVVPGLRHFWRRLGAGRLYDVPVALGRLERPLGEADLNSVPLFL